MTLYNDQGILPYEEYVKNIKCGYCKAKPGEPCKNPNGEVVKYHSKRQDRAIYLRTKDIQNAPWPENQEPGRCYSTSIPESE